MPSHFDLPRTPVARAALDSLRSVSESVANHSIRTFFFAELVAHHDGVVDTAGYDRDLLFASCVMHDLGTGERASGAQRFEIEGADLATAVLGALDLPAADIDQVWEAIALHTSAGIAERRGWLSRLTRDGVGMDFGRRADLAADMGDELHVRFPRLDMERSLVDAIVDHARRSPEAAANYSMPGELLREREATGTSRIEQAAVGSVWNTRQVAQAIS
jgi:HD domain